MQNVTERKNIKKLRCKIKDNSAPEILFCYLQYLVHDAAELLLVLTLPTWLFTRLHIRSDWTVQWFVNQNNVNSAVRIITFPQASDWLHMRVISPPVGLTCSSHHSENSACVDGVLFYKLKENLHFQALKLCFWCFWFISWHCFLHINQPGNHHVSTDEFLFSSWWFFLLSFAYPGDYRDVWWCCSLNVPILMRTRLHLS